MDEFGLKPDDYATKEEIFEVVSKVAINTDANNYIEFKQEVMDALGEQLFVAPESEWAVEAALQEYRGLALGDEE